MFKFLFSDFSSGLRSYFSRALPLVFTLVLCPAAAEADTAKAMFAGGCFWCVESVYQEHPGVIDAISGFTGGMLENPTYSGNHEGHYEAVLVTYDSQQVTYKELLALYWRNIDPFDDRGQFCDKGFSYRAAIFPANAQERSQAEHSRDKVAQQFPEQRVVTEIIDATTFWPVEEYHQDYYLKNALRYKYYRWGCGRDQRLNEVWGTAGR